MAARAEPCRRERPAPRAPGWPAPPCPVPSARRAAAARPRRTRPSRTGAAGEAVRDATGENGGNVNAGK
ncbi:hypothetical protein EFP18_16215 [Burkholderia glumae]|nr:hypothetical protein DF052_04815 [Burkholderia glumae]UVS85504.1 hypothetical protein EFP18_16215 [Burkholderia glumae]